MKKKIIIIACAIFIFIMLLISILNFILIERYTCTITSIDGKNIIVETVNDEKYEISTNNTTIKNEHGDIISVTNLNVGDVIKVIRVKKMHKTDAGYYGIKPLDNVGLIRVLPKDRTN